jgi:hypothetical protein
MVAILVVGLVLTRVTGRTKPHVTKTDAVAIARTKLDFKSDGYNIRLIRRGIPPRAYWIVSFWTRKASGGYGRITLVLVDSSSGRITEVRHKS